MNARTMMLPTMDDCRKLTSIAAFAVVVSSWASGLTAMAAHPTSRRNPPATENPIFRVAKQPLDCTGRFLGVGWGDGYHGCHGSGFRPGADLPPKSSHATRRWISRYGYTYYDRFDNHNLIHPRDFQTSGRSPLHACDQPTIAAPIISESFDQERELVGNEFEAKSVDLAVEVPSPIALPAVVDRPSTPETPVVSVADTAQRLPQVTRPDPPLPPAPGSSANAASKPARMPVIGEKPCRVAQFVPRSGAQDRVFSSSAIHAPATSPLPEQPTTRLAEMPQWALDAASNVQQNPFAR